MSLYARSVQGSTDQSRVRTEKSDKIRPGTGLEKQNSAMLKQHPIGPGPVTSHLAVRGSLIQSKDESFKINIKNYRAWPTSQEGLSIGYKKLCNVRESNPGLPRGRREFYH